MDMAEKALQFATKAHEGQKRRDGKPYISHPIAVAKSFNDIPSQVGEFYRSVAVLHDVVEDCDVSLDEIEAEFSIAVRIAVDALSRRDGESYKDFILRCCKSSDAAAKVKIADINHNLSDLKKGSLRDKYELAKVILEDAIAPVEAW